MAFGGFKAFLVDVQGVGSGTMSDVASAIKDIADGIIATGEGWSVDTAKNASTAEADQISVGGEAQAVFLVHTSGAHLMVTMNLNQAGFDVSQVMNWEMTSPSWDGSAYGGLSMCMLPSGQDFDVSNITTSSFLPATGLRIVGNGGSYSSSPKPSFLYDGSVSNFMRYMVAVRGDQIIVASRRNDWTNSFFLFILGNIYQCVNASDTYTFGVFRPFNEWPNHENDTKGSITTSNTDLAGSDFANSQIYATDGTLDSGKVVIGAGLAHGYAVCNTDRKPCNNSFGSNERRFVPIYAYMEMSGTAGYGVVANDGYKGIINPEICCITYYNTAGTNNLTGDTILDGGNIKYIGNGICIGWDSSNTINFWS